MTIDRQRLKEEARIQDIVARTAGISLRDTVRVLRSLVLVLDILDEKEAEAGLNRLLYRSATFGKYPALLHSKPDALAVNACNDFAVALREEFGNEVLGRLFNLTDDPYYTSKVNGPNVSDTP